ncbi:MAG: hypothetical protein Q9193_000588, partial [Seirophora villosa]
LLPTKKNVQFPRLGINHNLISVSHQGDRTSSLSLRDNMSDQETMRSAAEPSVCEERDVLAQTGPHDGAARFQHFRHAWSSLGSFVADDDNGLFALFESALFQGVNHVVLGIKDFGFAGKARAFLASDFPHAASRCEATA